jgi:hypothetical protein
MSSGGRRTYTAEFRAEAVALAAVIGPLKAGQQLGIPPRNVARWCHEPAASPIIAAIELSFAEKLEAAHARALAAVEEGLNDPKARLGDRAQALRVLGEQSQLAHGRATANVAYSNANGSRPAADWSDAWLASLTDEQRANFLAFIDRLPSWESDITPDRVEKIEAAFLVASVRHFEYPPRDELFDPPPPGPDGRTWLSSPDYPPVPQLPERTGVLPATMPPEALERPRTNETPSPVVRVQEPPPRRLIVNERGELI